MRVWIVLHTCTYPVALLARNNESLRQLPGCLAAWLAGCQSHGSFAGRDVTTAVQSINAGLQLGGTVRVLVHHVCNTCLLHMMYPVLCTKQTASPGIWALMRTKE